MSRPKISIVTPSFQQGHFIEQTIDSVLSQGYENLEYVIIDGGSNDETTEIIKKHEKHLSYWESAPDRGQSHAINKGLSHCKGDIFNWLNSDDYYEVGALDHVADVFMEKQCQVYSGRSRIFDNTRTKYHSRGTDVYAELCKTIGRARIDQPETFWDQNIFKAIAPVNESLHYLMDRDLWVRYLMEFGQDKVIQDDSILVSFRHHEDSKTVSLSDRFNAERNEYFFKLAQFAGLDLSSIPMDRSHEDLGLAFSDSWDKELIHRSIPHFLLLLAEETYGKRKMRSCSKILACIDPEQLDKDELTLFNKLTTRAGISKFYPPFSK